MDLIADGLLLATALTAALYCLVLSRRLARLTDAEAGIGVQIQSLSRALEETRSGLAETRRGVTEARGSARNATETLGREVERARQTLAELGRAHTRALDLLGRIEEAEPAAPPPRRFPPAEAVPRPARPVSAAAGPARDRPEPETPGSDPGSGEDVIGPGLDSASSEDIPDWPDGVIMLPEDPDDGAEPAAEPGEPPARPAPFAAEAGAAVPAAARSPLRVERMAL